jgi:tetratricopeptide (TPR) repeat protein
MDLDELATRYEVFGDESSYAEVVRRYQEALSGSPADPHLLTRYGFMQECHGRRAIEAAAECYQQAIAADPGYDKPHWQLIGALAAIGQAGQAVTRYRQLADELPVEPRWLRFLASACLRAGDHEQAARAIAAGLAVAPDDPSLLEQQGDLYAAAGQPEDALASWQRAYSVAPDDYGISMRYSAADLLERLGRPAEAAQEWRFIVDWCEARGLSIEAAWPKRELRRLQDA